MKKILIGCALLASLVSCNNTKSNENTANILDSIKEAVNAEEQAAKLAEEARMDSIRQDSIAKMEKFIAAIPSFAQVNNGNYEKLFKSLGYTISHFTTMGWNVDLSEEVPIKCVIANYKLDDKHSVSFREEPQAEGFKMTIIGAPEELTKFGNAAKAEAKKMRATNPNDWYYQGFKATVNGNTVTYTYPTGD